MAGNFELSVSLFVNVSNSEELKKRAINGEINAALLSPLMVLDQFQLMVSANKALHNHRNQKLTTKNLHSELLFCMSPTRSISTAFQKFGMQSNDKEILIVEIHAEGRSSMADLCQKVTGDLVPLSTLKDYTNAELIKKTYKTTDAELRIGSLLDAVITRISTKDLVSF